MVSIQQRINQVVSGCLACIKLMCYLPGVPQKKHGMAIHMNKSRLFNAVISSMISAKEICYYTNSI